MVFKKLIAFIFSVACSASFTYAQPHKGNVFVRTNLLSLVDPYGWGPTLGVEYFINDNYSIGSDASFIAYRHSESNEKKGNPIGYRIKPEIRYYLDKKNKNNKAELFFGLEGHYLKTKTRVSRPIYKTDNNGNTIYSYFGGYDEIRNVTGAALKFGIQKANFKNKKWLFESYVGLGAKYRKFNYEDLQPGIYPPVRRYDDYFLSDYVDGTYPTMVG